MNLFRTTMEVQDLTFDTFDAMLKYILTAILESAFKHSHFLVSVILVLSLVTADCKLLFSKLGYIKIDDRNRHGDILKELFLKYGATSSEKQTIDICKLAEKLEGEWSFEKIEKKHDVTFENF